MTFDCKVWMQTTKLWHSMVPVIYSPIQRCHSVMEIKRLIFLYKTECFVKKSAIVHQEFNSKIGENLVVYTYTHARPYTLLYMNFPFIYHLREVFSTHECLTLFYVKILCGDWLIFSIRARFRYSVDVLCKHCFGFILWIMCSVIARTVFSLAVAR